MCLATFPRICRQEFSFAKVTPVYTQFLDSRAKLSFQITWRVLPPQWRNNFSNNWILHWDCYNKNVKWIISRQRAKSVQHHNKRWLKPIRGLPGLCVVSTLAILKPVEKTWEKHKTSAGETMPRLRGFMGYWYLYLWDSSEGLFSLLVFLHAHRRTGNFLPGGAVNHLPKKISQVAQIFTKESKRNEGHIVTT